MTGEDGSAGTGEAAAPGQLPSVNALAVAEAEAARLAETLALCATDLALAKRRIGMQAETEAVLRAALADAEVTISELRRAQEVGEEIPREGTSSPASAKFTLRAIGKRLLKPLWRIVRPVVRPLLWRGRTFLLGPATQEIAELRAAQQRIAEAIEMFSHNSAANVGASSSAAAGLTGVSRELEAALLTVALGHARPEESDQGS